MANPIGGNISGNNMSNPAANRFKSFINPNAGNNPYNAINLNQNNMNNNVINESALEIQGPNLQYLNNNNNEPKLRGASPSPISIIPNQSMLNTTVNIGENSPNQNNDFDPYKSINMPSGNNLNNAFNNINSDFNGEVNNNMNLNISVIRPNNDINDVENSTSNYPEFYQLNRDSITSNNNVGGFNFNNANNFEANFNDFNDMNNIGKNDQNMKINGNNFPDKEFDF